MNKKALGIVLGCAAIAIGVMFIIAGINQIRGSTGSQPAVGKEEIAKALDESMGEALVFEDPNTGIRLSYPKNWTKEEGDKGAVVFKLFDGAVNIRYISDDLTSADKPVGLKEYTDELMSQSIAEAKNQNVAIKALSDEDTVLAGLPAHQWIYTVTLDSIQGHGMQVWTVKNGRSYVLTFTSPEDLFETFLPIFKKMLSTAAIVK
jgi:hypothetical protein